VGEQPPPWDAFGQQDPRQGQYPPHQQYGQQDPNQYQGQPPYPQQSYGQQSRQPSFAPGPQYAPPSGEPPYQGQPYQDQPYGPPGSQQPFPPPGYGYGPQPPRRKRHLVRNILAGIGATVVAIIAIGAISSHGDGVSTTPSGNSSTVGSASSPAATHQATVARVGSYFDVQDFSGDAYRVTLVKVIDPARGADEFSTPDNGKRFVGAVFRVKALKGSPQDEDANNDAVIVGSNGQSYTADFDRIAGYTNFADGVIHVAQGETITGAVTFQVPDHVKVAEIQWGASSNFGSVVQWNVSR
jgi:hypothetical protein